MSAPLYSNVTPAEASGIVEDVLCGLTASRKTLPPKLFYDEEGARLFERICTLDEYYLTRTELSILRESVAEIGERVGPRAALQFEYKLFAIGAEHGGPDDASG